MCRRSALDVDDRDEGYRRTILVVSFLVCFVLLASRGSGQTVGAITGTINGTVTDTTGAILAGVTVVASSDAVIGNKGKRTTVANGDGLYRFPALPPGEYKLVFTLDGFTTFEREGIFVGVGLTTTINVELHVATLREKVTVVHDSPVIDQQLTAIAITHFNLCEGVWL